MVGTRIGHYEITELMGVGGMGEVYRARDLTLDREVAIKVLPEEWARDGERLARLQREARVLAQLDHPNIAAIHGLEEVAAEDGAPQRLLVMQLAEGETLQEWIGSGRLSTGRALEIGLQITAGLEAAHERGVVHRDLKPANVKVFEDSGGHPHVKLLDFGLAKAYQPDGSASDLSTEVSGSPTVMAATRTGVILGTAAYMSPEQARGRAVDKRADIWAFGVVMFEMLTGRKLFDGETVSDMLAGVLKTEPDFGRLPPDLPPRVKRLLQRCLEKDPTQRLRDIGEARLILESPGEVAGPATSGATAGVEGGEAPATVRSTAVAPSLAILLPWTVAAVALALAAWSWVSRSTRPLPSFHLDVAAPLDSEYQLGGNSGNVVISPDGTKLAFAATSDRRSMLWVRPLAEGDALPLPGTEEPRYPFWSPDSSRLAFFADGQLKTVDVSGGIPEVIAPAPNGRGGSWGDDGTVLFTPEGQGTVHKVHESGGAVDNLTTLAGERQENAHYFPVMLPGSERFLYFARGGSPETSGIYLARVDGASSPVRVVPAMSSGIYSPPSEGRPGHLLWVRDGTLLAQPFDPETGALGGSASAIVTGVRVLESQRGVFASVSNSGILAWADARAAANEARWYNREGRVTGTIDVESGSIVQMRLMPGGDQLLFGRIEQGTSDLWLHDISSGTTRVAVATPGYDELPSWSMDGRSFTYIRDGGSVVLVDATGEVEPRVLAAGGAFSGASLRPGGNFAVFTRSAADGSLSLVAVPTGDPDDVTVLTEGDSRDFSAGFSPDGEWMLVVSDQSGTPELWAARFVVDGRGPRLERPWYQVSTRGAGPGARWTDDEILYMSADRAVISVPVTRAGASLEFGRETRLFVVPDDTTYVDFATDGQSFVVVGAPYAAGQTLHVLTRWQSRLNEGR